MNKNARLCRFLALRWCSGASRRSLQRTIITTLLITLVAVVGFAQEKKQKVNRMHMYGTVADGFTKAAITDVKVILMHEDSTAVDTTKTYETYSYSSGIGRHPSTSRYYFYIKREPGKYILKAEHPNYETAYANFEMKQVGRRVQEIEGPKIYLKKSANAHHFEGGQLDEVVVKATKVKMVWRGDTLVFNADAFNVPEGSMLDGLIKQLPGVELKSNGEIFVNGKKIENLTLNGADFFKGKNKIMLENLPYFTVKSIEVYKKQTEENKYLGIEDEDKKEYTMDVILKREYSIGGSANVEAGTGPSDGSDWRYRLKVFGLRFSDHTRAVLFGGMNNINESLSYDTYDSEYKDKSQQSGDLHFKQVGGQFVYMAAEDKLTNSTEVNATWSNEYDEYRSQNESYLNTGSTFGLSEGTNHSKPSSFSLKNTLRTTGKYRLYSTAQLNYYGRRHESEGWNMTSADAVMKDSINSSWYRSRSQSDQLNGRGYAYLTKRLSSGDSWVFDMEGGFNRQYHPESTSQNRYIYHQLGTQDYRDRRTESPSYSYDWSAKVSFNYKLMENLRITPSIGFGTGDNHSDRHEYLRDSIDYLFDAKNSYEQATQMLNRRTSLSIDYSKNVTRGYLGIYTTLSANFQRQRMEYCSEPLTTSITRNYTLWSPNVYMFYMKQDSVKRQDISMQYYLWPSTPSVTDLIDRPISSDPLNIFLGNPDLKLSAQHYFTMSYSQSRDSTDLNMSIRLNGSLTHNARTQGYTYDTTTGVRTYRLENISSGNWTIGMTLNWSRALDQKKFWHIGNELNLGYNKSTGLAIATGSTDAELSRVGSFTLNYKPNIRFQKEKLTLQAKGDIGFRNIHRNITFGQQPTDVWDISYGLNGNYQLPWGFSVDTDLTMHSRRGYTDIEMNDNRLYWDASLTKSFHQGQWLIKLRGYDLLGQVSSLRYDINSQGRTETWTNSMRRYALLTVSYRFSQKPKKK